MRLCPCCRKLQDSYIKRYYSLWDQGISDAIKEKFKDEAAQEFIGGYFYWHFNVDVLDKFTFAKQTKLPESERFERLNEAQATLNTIKESYKTFMFNSPK